MEAESASPISHLPQDTLHLIFSKLPLRQIALCRTLSKSFLHTLSSPSFLHSLPSSLPLLALRPHHHHHHLPNSSPPSLHAFDPSSSSWLHFPLSFLPFPHLSPISSSLHLLYLWAPTPTSPSSKSLLVCNPLTHSHLLLPPLGSAWSKHGSVLTASRNQVLVLTELATLYFDGSLSPSPSRWLKFSSNLPSKPRTPLLLSPSTLFSLCDVGSPWRSHWKLFTCRLPSPLDNTLSWSRLDYPSWGDVFDVLKRPRLLKGKGNALLMVGGLKSSFSLNAVCSTIVVLRLDLERMEWEEAARMPPEMYKCFQESSKFKVFGGGDRVCFSAKRLGRLAFCDCGAEWAPNGDWRWIDGVPGCGDGLCRGFVFEAGFGGLP